MLYLMVSTKASVCEWVGVIGRWAWVVSLGLFAQCITPEFLIPAPLQSFDTVAQDHRPKTRERKLHIDCHPHSLS
jgi:hypothetical protein